VHHLLHPGTFRNDGIHIFSCKFHIRSPVTPGDKCAKVILPNVILENSFYPLPGQWRGEYHHFS
jgi:hypothetical protein